MRKLQTQGVHHITIVGADRQTSIDFWEGVLGMPFVFEQPNLDNASESHLYFDPGDGRLITIFTNEEREVDPARTSTDPGCVHHIALAVSQATFHQAVERLDERGIRHSGVKDRGFMDSVYFEDPLGLLIELASYRFEPPHGHTHADVLLEAHKLASTSRTRSRRSSAGRRHPSRTTAHRRTRIAAGPQPPAREEDQMADNTLNILRPSVNNLTARIFVRTAGLDFEEIDVWGKKDEPDFVRKDPAQLTPMLETSGLPRGSLWESCAIMQYLCNKHGLDELYPTEPGQRAMIDSAMFYLIGTLYPLVARATYPTLGFPQYAGEVATSDADDEMKAKAQRDAEAAIAAPLDSYRAFFLEGKRFIGGDSPSIADIRLAATLEFLRAIDYDFPTWAEQYMSAMEATLGEAYSEPAADVRGFIESVKAPAAS
jgi:glutathione S-transferase